MSFMYRYHPEIFSGSRVPEQEIDNTPMSLEDIEAELMSSCGDEYPVIQGGKFIDGEFKVMTEYKAVRSVKLTALTSLDKR